MNQKYLFGLSIFSIFSSEDVDKINTNLKRRIQGEEFGDNEYLAKKKDRSTFPALVYVNIIYKNKVPVALRGVMADISAIKKPKKKSGNCCMQLNKVETL